MGEDWVNGRPNRLTLSTEPEEVQRGPRLKVAGSLELALGSLSDKVDEQGKKIDAWARQIAKGHDPHVMAYNETQSKTTPASASTYTFLVFQGAQPGWTMQLRRLVVFDSTDMFASSAAQVAAYRGMQGGAADGSTEPVPLNLIAPAATLAYGVTATFGRGECTLKSGEAVVVVLKTAANAHNYVASAEFEMWREGDLPSEIAP